MNAAHWIALFPFTSAILAHTAAAYSGGFAVNVTYRLGMVVYWKVQNISFSILNRFQTSDAQVGWCLAAQDGILRGAGAHTHRVEVWEPPPRKIRNLPNRASE